MEKPVIKFQSYNPYEKLFPNFRVISREELELIKMLRLQGYKVIVEPHNRQKLVYTAKKGLYEILTDPIFLFVLSMPSSFLMSHLANIYKDHRDRLKLEKSQNSNRIVMEFQDNGEVSYLNEEGKEISVEEFSIIVKNINSKREMFKNSLITKPNFSNESFPIHLEHTERVVGWAENLKVHTGGVQVESIHITDDEIWEEIEKGNLQGLSVGGLVLQSTCMICKREYVSCNHITSFTYNKIVCSNRIDNFKIGDVSIVKNPAQPLAKLKLVKTIK